jgi:hypothetical protein
MQIQYNWFIEGMKDFINIQILEQMPKFKYIVKSLLKNESKANYFINIWIPAKIITFESITNEEELIMVIEGFESDFLNYCTNIHNESSGRQK